MVNYQIKILFTVCGRTTLMVFESSNVIGWLHHML